MIEIRFANIHDIASMNEIESCSFPVAEAASKETIIQRFQTFPENFIVAVKNQQVIGYINGCTTSSPILPDELYYDCSLHQPQGEYQTVFSLAVLPAYRNQGIAGQLLQFMIDLSIQRGKKGIVLTCKDYLIHYYEKFGFVHQGVSISQHGQAKWNDMLLLFSFDHKKV